MKISSKAQLIVLVPSALIVVALLFVLLTNFRSALSQSAVETAKERLSTMANFIDAKNLEAVYTAKSMALMQSSGGFGERELSLAYARSILEQNPHFQGAYFGYEPNADGNDSGVGTADGCCTEGRFLPYFYRDGGQIKVDPLVDMETSLYYNGVKEQWQASKGDGAAHNHWLITEPYIYEGVPIVEHTYPLVVDGKFVGIAGVDRQLTSLFELVDQFRPYESSKTFLISRLGKFITTTHNKEQMAMQGVSDFADYAKMMSDAVDNGAASVTEAVDPESGAELISVSAPIATGEWTLVMTVEKSELLAPVSNTMWTAIAMGGALLMALTVFVGFAVRKFIVGSLQTVLERLQEIASGEGDLTARIDVVQKDEVGELATAFNAFVDKLNGVVSNIVGVSKGLTDMTAQLEHVASEASVAVDKQRGELQSVTSVAQELSASSVTVDQHIMRAREDSRSAESSAVEGKSAIQKNRDAVHTTSQSLVEAHGVVEQLNQRSADIDGVVDVINSIAEQTNLLALNAAIEAARAGEQGRGFAVVADEVRTLAQKTQESIKEIQNTVEALKSSSESAVECMASSQSSVAESVSQADKSMELLENIAASVADTARISGEVSSAASEQKRAIESITSSVSTINGSSDAASASADKARELSRELSQITDSLNDNLSQFKV